jgi:hypothetical protein
MFQMQIYIAVVLLLCSGAVSGGLEKVLRVAEFVAELYISSFHTVAFS